MRALLFAFVPLLAACSSPGVGDLIQPELTLTLTAHSSEPTKVAVGDAEDGLGVTRAFVAASALSLVPCSKNVGGIVLDPRGYDLLRSPSEAVTTGVTEWCALELDLDPVDGTTTPGVPDGATLYVSAKDAADTAFSFSSDRSTSLRLEAADPEGFPSSSLIIGFDMSKWLAGLPIAEPDMTETESGVLYDQLLGSVALYVDSNLNQELDDDETTPIATASR
jgi:hypothetical protein